MRRRSIALVALTAALAALACRGAPPPTATATPTRTPEPTATPVPTLPPAAPSSNLEALAIYAEQIQPIVEAGLAAAERDGAIIEASQEDESALCGEGLTAHPTLAADAALMDDLLSQLQAITPPPEASASVHTQPSDSVRLWGEALDNINASCETDEPVRRGILRAGAVLQAWAAAANFKIAADNFVLLLLANGLEALASW